MPLPRLSDVDACPGALRLHQAADGPLARIRLPGGMITGRQLAALAALAHRWGDAHVEFTSRANAQLRAVAGADPQTLAAALSAAGLLPSAAHETVRNIAAPALASPTLRALVRTLDESLCADPTLATLPGRFLFAIGPVPLTADVTAIPLPTDSLPTGPFPVGPLPASSPPTGPLPPSSLPAGPPPAGSPPAGSSPAGSPPAGSLPANPLPAGSPPAGSLPASPPPAGPLPAGPLPKADKSQEMAKRREGEQAFAILFDGVDEGLRVGRAEVVPALLAAAHAFLRERNHAARPLGTVPPTSSAEVAGELRVTPAWRVRELAEGPARVARRTAAALGRTLLASPAPLPAADAHQELIGAVEQDDGLVAVAALLPLGRLGPEQLAVLARADHLVVTPWRGVVIPDLSPAAAAGWLRALAGAGLPVERNSRWTGVTACAGRPGCHRALADVRADAAATASFVAGLPVHWVGCARGCGSPDAPHVRVEATPSGYLVDGEPAGSEPAGSEPAGSELGDLVARARRQ